jgi:peptide/nickel transport system permease protein
LNAAAIRILRIPLTIGLIWFVLGQTVPGLMARFEPYVMRPGFSCARTVTALARGPDLSPGACRTVADLYGQPFVSLFIESAARSIALLLGAAVLALIVGVLLGIAVALLRRHAIASGGIVGITTMLASVPAFFVAYFLQIFVIVVGASPTARERLLPVYGFGWDEHLILPLLSISLPAITYTAQLTATRVVDVLDTDFVTTARAKGLGPLRILAVHVLPHVRPVMLEALGSGLRVSVASLPIVEYLFQWRGIAQLALEAIGIHDSTGFIFSALTLAALFTSLSAIADLSRPRALYRAA